MAFSNFNTDYRRKLELHKRNGNKSSLSIHQVARIMDGLKSNERNEYQTHDVLVNMQICLN